MSKHYFTKSLAAGKRGEQVFSTLLKHADIKEPYTDVSNVRTYQALGIDFLIGTRKVGYDVKYDARAAQTGNIAIETVSVQRNDVVEKQGWLYTSQADYIVYLFDAPQGYRLAFYTLNQLQGFVRYGRTRRVKNDGYESVVSILSLGRTKPFREFRFNPDEYMTSDELKKKFRDVILETYSGVN